MGKYEVVVPKLGESVIEATITRWLKQEGEMISEDEPMVEIATDKVDSEIVAPVGGVLSSKIFKEGDIVAVGAVFAILEVAGMKPEAEQEAGPVVAAPVTASEAAGSGQAQEEPQEREHVHHFEEASSGTRFYSPLVKSIARQENIPFAELDNIKGTGKDDRITKHDILNYVKERDLRPVNAPLPSPAVSPAVTPKPAPDPQGSPAPAPVSIPQPVSEQQVIPGNDRIVEMDRIRQLIANHMVKSVQTSPHVTSFMEADMTRIVQWREKNKDTFSKRENSKLTFTPVFIEAIAKAVRDFPMINVSLDGTKIIIHKNINIGMAVAMPNFNLIVPVVRNADEKNLLGLVKNVNDLAERARIGKLVPDEITGGTISITNLGSFGTLMGTPIINQPQTAIVAVGAIKKRPVVVETPDGDVIAIRPIMMISVTYDHRVIDGALGGQFLARVVQYLENFDLNQPI